MTIGHPPGPGMHLRAEIEVEALGAFPAHPLNTVSLAVVADDVRMLHACFKSEFFQIGSSSEAYGIGCSRG
jgi:hypothetical protein